MLLRGCRIALSDVEAVLEGVPGVEQAVALVQDDPTGAQRLVAYVTPAGADSAAVLAALRGKLPAHLVPASVTALPQVCFRPVSPVGELLRDDLHSLIWALCLTVHRDLIFSIEVYQGFQAEGTWPALPSICSVHGGS